MTGAHKYRQADDSFDVQRFLYDVERSDLDASKRDMAKEADVDIGALLRAFNNNALTLTVACRLADWADLKLDNYRRSHK